MADKTVKFVIDARVWNEFRAQSLLRGETAKAAIVNLVTTAVDDRRKDGDAKARRRSNG